MKLLFKVAVVASTFAAASMAHAQGFTGEVAVLSNKVSTVVRGYDVSSSTTSLRGIVGLDVAPNLSVETLFVLGMTGDDLKVGNFRSTVSTKVDHVIGLFVKPRLPVNEQLSLFARLGYASTKLSVGFESVTDGSMAYGFGANYNLTKNLALNADYTQYHNKGGVKIGGVAVGVGYKF